MSYVITINVLDSDDVQSASSVMNGRTTNVIDLDAKTYVQIRTGDNISTVETDLPWDDNLAFVSSAIGIELNRIQDQILVYNAEMYEVLNFPGYGPPFARNQRVAYIQSQINTAQANVAMLQAYTLSA